MEMLLEICAYNIESCEIAVRAGADRVEYCAGPTVGGITPTIDDVQYLLKTCSIPVYPIIRPRGGNYIFEDDEIAAIKKDILLFRELGCRGISTGAANPDLTINKALMLQIADWAGPMEVTCHKVFDETPDAFAAMETLIEVGVKRILTSGLQKTATEGAGLLGELVKRANGRIIIMPGGSVRSANIEHLIAATGAKEYHSSGITQNQDGLFVADEWEIKKLKSALLNN